MPDPLELLRLRSTTAAYLSIVRDVAPVLADVDAYSELYEELGWALRSDEQGTPASIDRVLAELLGEAS